MNGYVYLDRLQMHLTWVKKKIWNKQIVGDTF